MLSRPLRLREALTRPLRRILHREVLGPDLRAVDYPPP